MTVVTKTGNDQKLPQTTTNQHKTPANDHKSPQTTSKQLQTTKNHQRLQTTSKRTLNPSKRPETVVPTHQTISFLFPAPGNYKVHPDFEEHTLHSANKYGVGSK